MATQEKTIEKQDNNTEEKTIEKQDDSNTEEKSIEKQDDNNTQDKSLTFLKEEKRLLVKIEDKQTILSYLKKQLISIEEEINSLEEQLECLRFCSDE